MRKCTNFIISFGVAFVLLFTSMPIFASNANMLDENPRCCANESFYEVIYVVAPDGSALSREVIYVITPAPNGR